MLTLAYIGIVTYVLVDIIRKWRLSQTVRRQFSWLPSFMVEFSLLIGIALGMTLIAGFFLRADVSFWLLYMSFCIAVLGFTKGKSLWNSF